MINQHDRILFLSFNNLTKELEFNQESIYWQNFIDKITLKIGEQIKNPHKRKLHQLGCKKKKYVYAWDKEIFSVLDWLC